MARLILLSLFVVGCAGSSDAVTRIVDGETLRGRYVDGDAYASFLRGVIAEEDGKLEEALAAYDQARAVDDEDPEIHARVARVRCAIKPGSGVRDAERALAIDREYGPALAALAACGVRAHENTARAAEAEPKAIDAQLWLARHEGERSDRLVALALDQPRASAYDALADLAVRRGEGALAARVSALAAKMDAKAATRAVSRCEELAGRGDRDAARALAAALVDGRRAQPVAITELVARLAVDEAILRGDEARVRARSSLGHVPHDEVAARAVLLGAYDLGAALAREIEAADPSSASARAVRLAADEARGARGAPLMVSAGRARVPAASALVLGRALARSLDASLAKEVLDAIPRDPVRSGDALETQIAVDLAARGILTVRDLPLDARIELALRQRVPFDEDVARSLADPRSALDARHRLLALAWTAPQGAETTRLAESLSAGGTRDPLVGAALVRIAKSAGKSLDAGALGKLAASAPTDPIVYATLIDASPQSEPLRKRLAAVAATKAERDLSSY